VVLVLVSLVTPPPPPAQVAGLTFQTPRQPEVSAHGAGWKGTDSVLSGILLVLVGLLWWYFS
jgi:hypothetical protein